MSENFTNRKSLIAIFNFKFSKRDLIIQIRYRNSSFYHSFL